MDFGTDFFEFRKEFCVLVLILLNSGDLGHTQSVPKQENQYQNRSGSKKDYPFAVATFSNSPTRSRLVLIGLGSDWIGLHGEELLAGGWRLKA